MNNLVIFIIFILLCLFTKKNNIEKFSSCEKLKNKNKRKYFKKKRKLKKLKRKKKRLLNELIKIIEKNKTICNNNNNSTSVNTDKKKSNKIIDIKDQEQSTMQIINNTNENYLHVFFEVVKDNKGDKKYWKKHSGNGNIYPAVDWGKLVGGVGYAWDPLGAKLAQEAVIPKGEILIVNIPDTNGKAFVVQAIKMVDSNLKKPLRWEDGSPNYRKGSTIKKVVSQWPILIEGGKDMVADASAVDGINFKINYSLTTDDNKIYNMTIHKNPCKNLSDKYKLDIGCRNPAKVDCANFDDNKWNPKDTCSCQPSTQNCAFNKCSKLLFKIPDDKLKHFFHKYDGGKPNMVVKELINNSKNLKDNSLKKFCNDIQWDTGDFTTYCYDYNDVGSSPWFRTPYKIRLEYTDLD